MTKPYEKLADSLDSLQVIQDKGIVAIRSADLSRTHRERLVKSGFLQPVMKGWYIPTNPLSTIDGRTSWYISYWDFCADYLNFRFGDEWCLSPEQSILIHAGNMRIPKQLLVRSPKADNSILKFPRNTSLFGLKLALPNTKGIEVNGKLRLFSIETALITCSSEQFNQYPTEMRTVLELIKDSSQLLGQLLDGEHSIIAGRLAGAFRNIGRDRVADEIQNIMRSANFKFREVDPFTKKLPPIGDRRTKSNIVLRINHMWQSMREDIIGKLPPLTPVTDIQEYLANVDEIFVEDAYHSLSIEGYVVDRDLIERVRSGEWNPDNNETDQKDRNTLAVFGYWIAFQKVRMSIKKSLEGKNPGKVANQDHGIWYLKLFEPSAQAGLLKQSDLTGYRNFPVYIGGSMHIPPQTEAMRDAMPAFFELLESEPDTSVRIILGHFIFVYIHPYMDGNGRMGRFLMNVMMAAGGYPWTVVPVERRKEYMSALEEASVNGNIVPFAGFVADLL